MKYLRWLYDNSKGVRGVIIVNILLGVLSIALNLAFIWACKRLVDVATHQAEGQILVFCIAMASLALLRILVNAANSAVESNSLPRMTFVIRKRLFSNLLQSQWQGKEQHHSGDTLNRLFTDVDTVTKLITQETPQAVSTLVQLIAAFAFLCTMSIPLAVVLLLICPVAFLLSKVFFRKMRVLTKTIRESESSIQSHIQEAIQHKTLVQSFEQEPYMESKLDGLQDSEYSQVKVRTRFNVLSRTIISIAFTGGYVVAFLWGSWGIWKGVITYGMMTAFLQLVGQIQGPAMRLTRQIPQFIYASASIDRLSELEDAPKEMRGDKVKVSGVPGVSVEHLTFRYPDGDNDVFTDFSYEFAPGTKTAIVGETGIGKSTLIRLMLALLRPCDGHVSLVHEDGSKVDVSPLTRGNFVYVPQGNSLFDGTIRQNLQMGDPSATDEQMLEALDLAAAEFVRTLPEGLDTVCGEQGAGLSEGQAQRIAIARALLRPGGVMLLDELSSSLDPETEARLISNIMSSEKYDGRTMIFITHREKIAEYCSRQLRLS